MDIFYFKSNNVICIQNRNVIYECQWKLKYNNTDESAMTINKKKYREFNVSVAISLSQQLLDFIWVL